MRTAHLTARNHITAFSIDFKKEFREAFRENKKHFIAITDPFENMLEKGSEAKFSHFSCLTKAPPRCDMKFMMI